MTETIRPAYAVRTEKIPHLINEGEWSDQQYRALCACGWSKLFAYGGGANLMYNHQHFTTLGTCDRVALLHPNGGDCVNWWVAEDQEQILDCMECGGTGKVKRR